MNENVSRTNVLTIYATCNDLSRPMQDYVFLCVCVSACFVGIYLWLFHNNILHLCDVLIFGCCVQVLMLSWCSVDFVLGYLGWC